MTAAETPGPGTPIPGQTKTEARLEKGWGHDFEGRALFWIAVAFSAFQIVTATFSPLPSQIVRSVHVGFLMIVVFGVTSTLTDKRAAKLVYWALGIAGFVLGFYHWVFYERPHPARRRSQHRRHRRRRHRRRAGVRGRPPHDGAAAADHLRVFLAYGLFGQYLPSPLNTRGYDFGQIVDQMFLGTEGIYGIPVYVSSTYIFLFILFGAFLERAGMITLFTDVAMGMVGHARGGPAKVAVIASGLMGTINGSGIANVVTVGQFTIPLMKRFGYPRLFRRRGRGDLVDGRADHAAGDGRGRLHHGRDHQRALLHRSARRDRAGGALLLFGLLGGASGSRQARPGRAAEGRVPEPDRRP